LKGGAILAEALIKKVVKKQYQETAYVIALGMYTEMKKSHSYSFSHTAENKRRE